MMLHILQIKGVIDMMLLNVFRHYAMDLISAAIALFILGLVGLQLVGIVIVQGGLLPKDIEEPLPLPPRQTVQKDEPVESDGCIQVDDIRVCEAN